MDKIKKALKKLSESERKIVAEILKSLLSKTLNNLNIKKLKGRDDIFRVRKGDLRIIYRVNDTGAIYILSIERRSEKTYKL